MKVESLIDRLVEDVTPVRRSFAPATLLAALVFLGYSSMILFVSRSEHSQRYLELVSSPWFVVEFVLMSAVAIVSGCAAIVLSFPGQGSSSIITGSRVLGILWGALLLTQLILELVYSGGIEAGQERGPHCAMATALFAIPPFLYLLWASSSAYPTMPRHTAGLIALSSSSFASIGVRLCCTSSAPLHLFVWHFLPVLALTYCGALLGPSLLRPKEIRLSEQK